MGENIVKLVKKLLNRILTFLKNNENKLLVLSVVIFLLWKIILVHTLWNGRLSPPESDDSYIYINHIESVVRCPSLFFCKDSIYPMDRFNGFSHLAYRIFFGYLAKISGLDSTTIYHLSFYIGSLMLVPVLLILLKSLTPNKKLIAVSLLFLMLPNGGGSTHSFFWIVPSFFALLLFFLILSVVLGESKKWKIWIIILIPLAFLTHTITIYLFFIFPVFLIIYSLLKRKIEKELVKKIAFTLLVGFIFYSGLSIYLNTVSPRGNSYGIEKFIKDTFIGEKIESIGSSSDDGVKELTPKKSLYTNLKTLPSKKISDYFPGYKKIRENYLKWVILNPLGFLLFVIMIWALLYRKNFRVLSLYLSVLIATLLSSIHQYGFRFLLLLWPMTFIFYAFGFWSLLMIISNLKKKGFRVIFMYSLVFIAIFILFVSNMFFSLFWSEYANKKRNYFFDPQYASYLKNAAKDEKAKTVKYDSKVFTPLHILYNIKKPSRIKDIKKANYYVAIEDGESSAELFKKSHLNKFLDFFSGRFGIKRQDLTVYPQNPIKIPSGFQKVEKFGNVAIYKNNNL